MNPRLLVGKFARFGKIDGKFVGDRTQITISKPSLAKLPDNLFTKSYLEKVSK